MNPPVDPGPEPAGTDLLFFNGYGGFSPDGREYVIRLRRNGDSRLRCPPKPWINVIANERFGFLISETGSGMTWSGNSREHRLTPWNNDVLHDHYGEAFYLRDEESGAVWSPLPGPIPAGDGPESGNGYQTHHGFGYSRFLHSAAGLEVEATLYVPRHDPVKIARVVISNRTGRRRRLSLFSYQRLVLGGLPEESGRYVVSRGLEQERTLLAHSTLLGERHRGIVFSTAAAVPDMLSWCFTADRRSFLGPGGTAARPKAIFAPAGPGRHLYHVLDGRAGSGLDPCAGQQIVMDVPPDSLAECCILLGEGTDESEVRRLLDKYRSPGATVRALEEVRGFWDGLLGRIRLQSPSTELDLMVNGWLLYQTLSCRIWARSALYQSGGAYGFRDQIQDSGALIPFAPELTREQILLHAAHQFVEGDVLHWWHPPDSRGIRTRFADDLLWLPYLTAEYVTATGDRSILTEERPYLSGPELPVGEDEIFMTPQISTESSDLYEHCCRAVDRSLKTGAHDLPLFGSGDWNDGMNRVGREGKGESVWMGFFLYDVLGRFIPLVEERSETERAGRYRDFRGTLGHAIEEAGWDGAWYRRGYYDDGTTLGSAEAQECRIDALVQAWAVISGAAPRERALKAMEAVNEHLFDSDAGLIRLLTPPFADTERDPGYIKGYVPGVRENGGQYTHAALWVVRAAAELGLNDRAFRYLEILNPIGHARSEQDVARYQIEPYVVAADVYGEPPHVGRGGWSWYTGSAGWMHRVALESILGLTLFDGKEIRLRPCMPTHWPGYEISYRVPTSDTLYKIRVRSSEVPVDGAGDASSSASLDDRPIAVERGMAHIPILGDGREHKVEILLVRG